MELFKEAVPKLAGVAVLFDPGNPPGVLQVKEVLPVAARALGLTVRPWEIRAADDFDKVFAALNKERADGLFVFGGPLINSNRKRMGSLALKSRLPLMCYTKETLDVGGLLYYGADERTLPARRILRGQNSEGQSLPTCRWSNRRSLSS